MKRFSIQMIDNTTPSHWWKSVMEHFIRVGDLLELRCWKEESEEIKTASLYGKVEEIGYEVSIKGEVTKALFADMLAKPTDKEIYNKMTKYFTIHVKNELCDIYSLHYGTEMIISIVSDKDIGFFEDVISSYSEYFSIDSSNNFEY